MHDRDIPDDRDAAGSGDLTGELDRLLREIEQEPVPARLLELALALQAALAERRRQGEGRETAAAN